MQIALKRDKFRNNAEMHEWTLSCEESKDVSADVKKHVKFLWE